MMTARQLGITPQEHQALRRVRNDLASGGIARENFNMRVSYDVDDVCGTVACIGGWTAIRMGELLPGTVDNYVKRDRSWALHPLFYPREVIGSWGLISPKMAVKAIDNFLASGNCRWNDVVESARD